jgi:hypothetical protein
MHEPKAHKQIWNNMLCIFLFILDQALKREDGAFWLFTLELAILNEKLT